MTSLAAAVKHSPEIPDCDPNSDPDDPAPTRDQEMVEPQASVWTLFDEKAAASTSIRNDFSDAMLEVRSYLEQLHIQRGGDPLNWWKAKSAIYPRLTKIMERKLCIVGTSVPSERVFSKTFEMIPGPSQ